METDQAKWSQLEEEADRKVLERWPYMAHVPKFKMHHIMTTSYKLYNLTVPINDHSIAFLGLQLVPSSYHTALAQTLYAVAAIDSTLKLPPQAEVERHVAFINRWCAHRYPTHGYLGNVCEFEMVSFTDRLLEELELTNHRPRVSWWSDMTDPCLASDYAGLVDEYRRKYISKKV